MNLKDSIYSLIKESEKELREIESKYTNIHGKIDSELDIKIGDFLGHLRTSLVHLSDQIFKENNLQHKKSYDNTYFPLYTRNPDAFKKTMKKNFPNLDKVNSSMYLKLEKIQSYNSPDREWMSKLRIVNEFKHSNFVEQHKKEKEVLEIGAKGKRKFLRVGPNTTFKNCNIDGVETDFLPVGPNLETPDVPGLEMNKITIQEYYFTKFNEPVVPVLGKMLKGVKEVMTEFEK